MLTHSSSLSWCSTGKGGLLLGSESHGTNRQHVEKENHVVKKEEKNSKCATPHWDTLEPGLQGGSERGPKPPSEHAARLPHDPHRRQTDKA